MNFFIVKIMNFTREEKMNVESEDNFSIQNINIIKKLYEAFVKHDFEYVLSILSKDVEWGEPANPFNPAAGTRYGHEGFLEWLKIGHESEEILALEPQKFLSDSDTVAAIGYTKCLAKPTNKIYETDFVHLFTIKNGMIIKFQEFFDTYAAVEAFRNI